jgi:hypothetical protein
MHGGDQAYQPEKVVPMQMTDQNMADALHMDMVVLKEHLGPLATIDKKNAMLVPECKGA